MKPLVSIIIASFNSARTIDKTLSSILNQNFNNYELIVIDGLSTDGSVDIIKSYESSFLDKLKWISENDNGIYDAWNKGLEIASGTWICFIGTDDYFLPDALENYFNIINSTSGINFISSMCLLVDYNYKPIRKYGGFFSNKMKSYCTIAHVGSFHKKELFDEKPYFNTTYKISADYDFLLRKFTKIIPVFFPVITAVVMNTGISGKNIVDVSKERTVIKIQNKSKPVFNCYIDFFSTIFKFYLRKYFI